MELVSCQPLDDFPAEQSALSSRGVGDKYGIILKAGNEIILPFKNLINDYYAKDISRKVTSALRSKMEKGEYIGSWEKYGYLKSPENKNQLVINPETAPVVQMIYQWRCEGMSYMGINKKLNDMNLSLIHI